MKRSPGPRELQLSFSESVHQRLNMYVLAASAAGVGVMALAQPVEAKIVYTPANVGLGSYRLDLNHDGIADFDFNQTGGCTTTSCNWSQRIYSGGPSNAVVGPAGSPCPMVPGAEIGPKRRFFQLFEQVVVWAHMNANGSTMIEGPWANGGKGFKGRYLGIRFLINGKIHYGWARLNTTGGFSNLAVLTGYAYETIPGKSIKAGQTKEAADDFTNEEFGPAAYLTNPTPNTPQLASLGLLAMGAPGLSMWRRESVGSLLC